jgi:cardiolipin synthase
MKREAWSQEVVFFNKEGYFSELLQTLPLARHSIELEVYIFEFDRLGREVLDALLAATKRGVRVRVVVDGLGSFFWIKAIRERLQGSRVELRVFHPFSVLGKAFAQVNRRLHRKVCLIDHQIAFVGSFNISDRAHRDTGVRLMGPPLRTLWEAFEFLWQKRFPFTRRKVQGLGLVRLNETKRMRRNCNHDLTRRIREAKDRIWITNAYFVPPFFLLKALCLVALTGVEVKLLVPAKSDHLYMKWLTETYYQTLILSGIRVFEYQGLFLHAKSILIDHSFCMVGSTNLNHRSLIYDLEVDVVLSQPLTQKTFESQFQLDLENSKEITHDDLGKTNIFVRLIQWILRFFRFWA